MGKVASALKKESQMGLHGIAARFRAQNEARFPKLKEIKTHPALDCIPLMKEDEFARLVWSIRKVGLIRPISQDEDGRILDGRCRLLACDIAGVEPELAPPKDGVAAYLYAANVARRHLTYGQRAMITVLVEDFVPDDGFTRAILSANLVRRHDSPSTLSIADALIDEPDFPELLVRPKVRLVARHPDLVRQIGVGAIKISEAYQTVLERDRLADEQAERAEAFERLRIEEPIPAAQVDEGALTVDQALTRANDDAEHLADHAEAIRALSRKMVADAIEIGQRLIDAKRLCGHGNWLSWLDREFGWSDDTALNYMRVAKLDESQRFGI